MWRIFGTGRTGRRPYRADGSRGDLVRMLNRNASILVALLVALSACGGLPPVDTTTTSTTTTTTTTAHTTTTTTTTAPPATTTTRPPATTTLPPGTSARVVREFATDRRVVALTFDAGSDRGFAPQILDLLAVRGVPATFGMTGRWAETNPQLLRRMVDDGHTIINHTYDHPHMETLTTAERLAQLAATETIVTDLTGVSTKPWFRPPFGSYNQAVLDDVGQAGYRYSVMWTVDSLGWKGIPASEVVSRCLAGAKPGAIILLHVGAQSTDFEALEDLIDGLERDGYGFVTIGEVLP